MSLGLSFLNVHGSLELLTFTPCVKGLESWVSHCFLLVVFFPCLSPYPGAEGCTRILGPGPNHRSWHGVQSPQVSNKLKPNSCTLSCLELPVPARCSLGKRATNEGHRTLLCCQSPHPWLLMLWVLAFPSPQGLDEPVCPVCSKAGSMPCGPSHQPQVLFNYPKCS